MWHGECENGTGVAADGRTKVKSLADKVLRVMLTAVRPLLRRRARGRQGVHAIALTSERRIILVKLRYAPGWRLPGGGREEHEDPTAAALRELREEIGMTAHGPARLASDAPDALLIVEDVRYHPHRWSWEVEEIMETPLDELPRELSPISAKWLAGIRDKI
jgi:8-oxo-dGTP pyrophosphatase MutT (NUDIX family)